jgi:glutathione S-transferase
VADSLQQQLTIARVRRSALCSVTPKSMASWSMIEALAADKGWTSARRLSAPFRARERCFDSNVKPSLVLWRDTYGWCPFCAPTQLLLEEKRIPYVSRKVPLNSYKASTKEKPPDFLRRVPIGTVPDLTFDMGSADEQTIIPPNGYDLLPYLEEEFESFGPSLAPPEGREHEAPALYRLSNAVQRAVSVYTSAEPGSRELATARSHLVSVLDELEKALGEHASGPYLFGGALSLPDLTLLPWLERADAVPRLLKADNVLHIELHSPSPPQPSPPQPSPPQHAGNTARYPRICAWLHAVRARPAYAAIRLDDESLCASVQNVVQASRGSCPPFMLWPGQSDGSTKKAAAAVPSADALAGPAGQRGAGSEAAAEAAHGLMLCRDGVLSLAATPPPVPSDGGGGAPTARAARAVEPGMRYADVAVAGRGTCTSEEAAQLQHATATDGVLRCVAHTLLENCDGAEPLEKGGGAGEGAVAVVGSGGAAAVGGCGGGLVDACASNDATLRELAGEHATSIASGLVFVRNRVQVPRDMSVAAAATLREALLGAAVSLVGEARAFALVREHEGAFACRRDFPSRVPSGCETGAL